MTETELATLVRTIGPMIREHVTKAVGELVPRLAVAEAKLALFEGRVQDDTYLKELGALRERVAVLEVRPAVPGPAGEPGPPGKDGTAGLSYEGVYQEGKTYALGQITTWAGSTWHCNEETTTKPGEGSKAWTLMVKRGRDGKDGRDAAAPLPVVTVR